jgi:membrane-bound lytic murein transglycosylase D
VQAASPRAVAASPATGIATRQSTRPGADVPRLPRPPAAATGASPSGAGKDAECLVEEEEEGDDSETPAVEHEAALNRALQLCQLAQAHWKRGDLELAIETLDEAYALILDVEPENDPKLLQAKEDLRFTISKRILEIYSSRQVTVNGNRNEIPITINRYVQDEIDSFTTGRERDFFIEAYRRSGRYRPRIQAALKENGLPAELSWLPLIESGFKVTALSPARALGLWQFIPSTGYRYGLTRDRFTDERLDPEKATRAAIEYLKELHGMFGDWTTVLAAYNCGEHRVLRTIQSQNINYLDQFWDLYERLPRETARYVPRFLATLEIVHSPEKYGLQDVVFDPPLEYDTVTVARQVRLDSIARVAGIDEATLRELNAELRQQTLPAEDYDLRVPVGMGDVVLAKMDGIPTHQPRSRVSVVRHKVRRGETLDGIAQRYGSDSKSIMLANNIRRPSHLAAGRTIRVPLDGCPPEPQPASRTVTAASAGGRSVEHVVQRGDSLWNLARRYRTTTEEIRRLNQLSSSRLTIGQVLKIADTTPPGKGEPSRPASRVYSVRNGDTLYDIAQQHNMSLDRLLALNNLTAGSIIQPGQKIRVE